MSKIEDKIQKLLRLAAGRANLNEAAAAFAQAQALADRHAIDLGALDVEREERGEEPAAPAAEITRIEIDAPARTRSAWRIRLASAVATASGCRTYTGPSHTRAGYTGIWAYGPADRLETVKTLYHWIGREVDRLGRIYAGGRGRTAGRDFRLGAAAEIRTRLDAERAKTLDAARADAYASGGETALARVSTAIARQDRTADVERYARTTLNLRAGSALAGARGGSAYAAGRAAGRTISTAPAGRLK